MNGRTSCRTAFGCYAKKKRSGKKTRGYSTAATRAFHVYSATSHLARCLVGMALGSKPRRGNETILAECSWGFFMAALVYRARISSRDRLQRLHWNVCGRTCAARVDGFAGYARLCPNAAAVQGQSLRGLQENRQKRMSETRSSTS